MTFNGIHPMGHGRSEILQWLDSNIYLGEGVLNNRSLLGGIVAFIPGAIWGAQTAPGERFLGIDLC